jgi:Ca2+-binding RTX toxin-like protein
MGSAGADILTGGVGADTFRLGGDMTPDHITDFVSGTDQLQLDIRLFTELSSGYLSVDKFGQGTKALTTVQRLIYDQTQGALYYDADGSGKGAAKLIAVLDNKAQLTSSDFFVV